MSARIAIAQARRRKAGLACIKKLDAAASALHDYLHACNECEDESASLSLQGKGRDGRETLIADLREYSAHLDTMYAKATGSAA